jgi:hypothetical protein
MISQDQGVAGLRGSSTNNGRVCHIIQNEKYSLSGRDVMDLRSLQLPTPSPSMEDTSSPDEEEMNHP